ncbi:MAG: hypothetical protein C4547_09555 [Phycisphaerales bacterium]|nr:MAG: hypothetical protein C4547_09555 [Phycisphaerales bacterium]
MLALILVTCLGAAATARTTGRSRPGQDAEPPTAPATPTISPSLEAANGDVLEADVVGARIRRLAELAEQAADANSQVTFRLAAANLILRHQIEPALTQFALGILPDDATRQMSPLCQAAMDLLSTAGKLLDSVGPDVEDGQWVEPARRAWRTLRVVAEGVLALSNSDPSDAAIQRRRSIRSELAILLEHPDDRIKAVATLLDIRLRSPIEDPQGPLRRLPLALDPLLSDPLPHGLFLRLERCRLVAESGAHAAAIAVLVQLEERCHDWFDGARREVAARTTALVRIQVLETWAAALASDGAAASEVQWCRAQIDAVRRTHFPPDADAPVLRFRHVIPLLVEVPDPAVTPAP